LEDPRTGRGVTAQNTTSLIAFGAGPVQSYASAAGLFTFVALLLQVLFQCIEVFALVRNFWEFVRFISDFLGTVVGGLGGCVCSCRRRQQTTAETSTKWEALVGSEAFYDFERGIRHDVAIRKEWSLWSLKSREIRRNLISLTWRQWNVWSGRLRAHSWHQARIARETLPRLAATDQRLVRRR
jgi:hypothetical protein